MSDRIDKDNVAPQMFSQSDSEWNKGMNTKISKDSFLSQAIHQLGFKSEQKQIVLVQVLHVMGAFDDTQSLGSKIDDSEAVRVINSDQYRVQGITTNFLSVEDATKFLYDRCKECRARLRNGQERQQMSDQNEQLAPHTDYIKEKVQELGLFDTVGPQSKGALIVLGANQYGVTGRLAFAASLIEQEKVIPKKVILLGGERDLWPTSDRMIDKGEEMTIELILERIRNIKEKEINEGEFQDYVKNVIESSNKKREIVWDNYYQDIVQAVNNQYGIVLTTDDLRDKDVSTALILDTIKGKINANVEYNEAIRNNIQGIVYSVECKC